jgi:IS5 family transposase
MPTALAGDDDAALGREALKRAGAVEKLFQRFDAALKAAGYLAMSGQIVDATVIAAPKQRNTEAEKEAIKAGRVPEGWAEKPASLRQRIGMRAGQ